MVPVVPPVPDQQPRGFEAEPPLDPALVPLVPPDEPAAPSWVDDRAWCARLGAAGAVERRRVVLREWVEAAGGWHDAAAVHLPDRLRNGLALTTLKAHARALGLDVRDDPDDPELLAWLRGGR